MISTKMNVFTAMIAAGLALFAGVANAAAPTGTPVAPAPATAAKEFPVPSPDADSYIIGPGDELQVFVWRNPELSATVPVLPDGKVSTPLVESIVATGKTPSQLSRDIEKALAEYVRSPKVSVLVAKPLSSFSQIKIVGQVKNPTTIPYRDGMTVLDAILQAGGLATYAAGNRARLMRKENGKDKEIKVKLQNLMENGDMKQNIVLRPGDILVVPETLF